MVLQNSRHIILLIPVTSSHLIKDLSARELETDSIKGQDVASESLV